MCTNVGFHINVTRYLFDESDDSYNSHSSYVRVFYQCFISHILRVTVRALAKQLQHSPLCKEYHGFICIVIIMTGLQSCRQIALTRRIIRLKLCVLSDYILRYIYHVGSTACKRENLYDGKSK